ncbi:MAG: class II glutamine amidotransferase [Phycisphaerales bacterium]|nr:class II glutamine amidotransferase [Phycisphaerae bacterium]NNF45044.1 class II glutamine amidotransferase [Phycisphaerales bacterium]NNM27477.1 class II glutamine amidotransferase [Phycisphaerales bacterium]
MCRFALYLGSPIRISALVTEPDHSIIHQSYRSREREEPLNGDGFGIGWYAADQPEHPAVFKDITPAWNNMNLADLARVTRTGCLLAHVRAASPGLPVTRLNCHPFRWNDFVFMHNGLVGGFHGIARRLRAGLSDDAYGRLLGTTDSELVFALFSDAYLARPDLPAGERMAAAVVAAITRVEAASAEAGETEPSQINLAVTDGRRAVVTRYATGAARPNSLYVDTGEEFNCTDGVCHMRRDGGERAAVIVASEPLSDDSGWKPVAADHMLLIDETLQIETRPLEVVAERR